MMFLLMMVMVYGPEKSPEFLEWGYRISVLLIKRYRDFRFLLWIRYRWSAVLEYSMLLMIGCVVAIVMSVFWPETYHELVHHPLLPWTTHHGGAITLHFLANEVLLAAFFFAAGKEFFEAVALKDGELRGWDKAMTPLVATLGGVVGPVAVYLGTAWMFGYLKEFANGWAIPTATDIAFAMLFARLIFGKGHPAVLFVTVLAIMDDAVGLIIVGGFYSPYELHLEWLGLLLPVMVIGGILKYFHYKKRFLRHLCKCGLVCLPSYVPYFLLGCVSWYAFYRAGIHPALGLLPIVPVMPHAESTLGMFDRGNLGNKSPLSKLEHALHVPVQLILGIFAFCNAGVALENFGPATWIVLSSLFFGKMLGIYLFTKAGILFGLKVPEEINDRVLLVLGMIAGIGFTVALFVSGLAFPIGPTQDAAKIGSFLSIFIGILAVFIARWWGIQSRPAQLGALEMPAKPKEEAPVAAKS